MTQNTYHIYLEDRCLFKNLNESEFDIISNNAMEIAQDVVTFNVFKEKNP